MVLGFPCADQRSTVVRASSSLDLGQLRRCRPRTSQENQDSQVMYLRKCGSSGTHPLYLAVSMYPLCLSHRCSKSRLQPSSIDMSNIATNYSIELRRAPEKLQPTKSRTHWRHACRQQTRSSILHRTFALPSGTERLSATGIARFMSPSDQRIRAPHTTGSHGFIVTHISPKALCIDASK